MDDIQAAVMHDVKNQLAELALRLHRRGDARAEMEIAMTASRRLSEMLLLERENNRQLSVNVNQVHPADFLEILAAEYAEFFPEKKLEVDAARAPVSAFFDDGLIRIALSNALHNACRHARTRVTIAAYEEQGMLALEIADDGPGFPDQVLQSAGEIPVASTGIGTGLGIYLANRIAQMHCLDGRCGRVQLYNDKAGAHFRMLLP